MPKTRNIYQIDALYVGPTGQFPATGKHFSSAIHNSPVNVTGQFSGSNLTAELLRIQNANYSFSTNLQDVNQYGELAAIDRVQLAPPTVELTTQWLVHNLYNERAIGLTVTDGVEAQISCVSGILNTTTDTKNYFVRTVGEGIDVHGAGNVASYTLGIGNGFISSYTAEGSVGNFPTASVTLQGLNMKVDSSYSGVIPAVIPTDGSKIEGFWYSLPSGTQNIGGQSINTSNSTISVLRPGDVTLTLGLGTTDGAVLESDLKVQNYSVQVDLNREDLQKLGSRYAFAKVPQFPVTARMSVTADVGDLQAFNLVDLLTGTTTFNPKVQIVKPSTTTPIVIYQLKGARIDSQEITSAIGQNKSVTINFSSQIGGPQSNTVGLFLSGVAA